MLEWNLTLWYEPFIRQIIFRVFRIWSAGARAVRGASPFILQSVMNTAARLVTRTRKFDHITPVLHDLHWLPIESRSKFKILLLVYKCLYGLAPRYLSKRLSLKPNRGLRSDDKLVLNVPTTKLKTKTYGDRCFSIAGPNLWNQLPSHIRLSKSIDVFKRSLKTHLFKDAFNL